MDGHGHDIDADSHLEPVAPHAGFVGFDGVLAVVLAKQERALVPLLLRLRARAAWLQFWLAARLVGGGKGTGRRRSHRARIGRGVPPRLLGRRRSRHRMMDGFFWAPKSGEKRTVRVDSSPSKQTERTTTISWYILTCFACYAH